jgi:hypothetical protein
MKLYDGGHAWYDDGALIQVALVLDVQENIPDRKQVYIINACKPRPITHTSYSAMELVGKRTLDPQETQYPDSELHIRSRSQTFCFHSGSLQPVADMNVDEALTSFIAWGDKGVRTRIRQNSQPSIQTTLTSFSPFSPVAAYVIYCVGSLI